MPKERTVNQQVQPQNSSNDEWIGRVYKALGLKQETHKGEEKEAPDYGGYIGGALDTGNQGYFEDGEWIPDFDDDDLEYYNVEFTQGGPVPEDQEPAGHFEDGVWMPDSDIDDFSLEAPENMAYGLDAQWKDEQKHEEKEDTPSSKTAEPPEKIAELYRTQRTPEFQEVEGSPSYDDVKSRPYGEAGGFSFYNQSAKSAFTKFDKVERNGSGALQPDKFHISVKQDQVEDAFKAIAGLLLSPDSPIDNWKVTNMDLARERAHEDEFARRVSEGAQFTLYMRTPDDGEPFSAEHLVKTRFFIDAIEAALMTSWIDQGQTPDSDVSGGNWSYVSYRNEEKSSRFAEDDEWGQQQVDQKNEDVFKALTL